MKVKFGYKLLVAITLILPISSFLIISMITGQTYDAELFKHEESSVIVFEEFESNYMVYSEKASYNGYITPYNEEYALLIDETEIVKIDREYFTPFYNEETQTYELVNLDDIPATVEKTNAWTVSIASILALLIAGMIIAGKMDLLKTHPRASAMVSLLIITGIFVGLNSIISDMMNVFIVVSASWAIYCIEYIVRQGNLTKKDGEKLESDILNALKGALK